MMIFLGALEACNAIFLKQTATIASYEAAKIAAGSGGTEFAARTRVEDVFDSRDIQGGAISFTPELEEERVRGTQISATVTIPTRSNMAGIYLFFPNKDLSATVVMVKQ